MVASLENAVFWDFPPKNREGHRSSFLISPSKVPKTTKKLSFHENDYGIQKNDPTRGRGLMYKFALPQKFNMAVIESDLDPKVRKCP